MLTLPPSTLHSLLYGFQTLDPAWQSADAPKENKTFLSIHPSDYPTSKVRAIPYDLGVAIINADPDENYFHVELFATTQPPRAELWNIQAWNGSLSKLCKHKILNDAAKQQAPIQERARTLAAELTYKLQNQGLRYSQAQEAANMLIYGPNVESTLVILLNIQGQLAREILAVRKEYQEMTRPADDLTETDEETEE